MATVHPITGTFAESDTAAAFRSKVFRFMLPMHVVALAALVATGVVFESDSVVGGALTMSLLLTSIGVLGISTRIAVHRWEDQDQGQRYGAFGWTTCVVSGCVAECIAYVPGLHLSSVMCEASSMYASPLVPALFAIITASHGMEFWHTLSLTSLALFKQTFVHIMCGMSPQTCNLVLVAVCAAGHFVQLHARHAFLWQSEHLQTRLGGMRQLNEAQRRLEESWLLEEKRQLEERNEQLRAEKERLMYDVQRRGRPLDEDDDRSAIRRGLQAGPNHPCPSTGDTSSSGLSGVKPPSESPPPSLPPGPPSSTSSGSTAPPLTWAKPTALPPTRAELDAQHHVEQDVAHVMLSCARGQTNHHCQSAEAACSGVVAVANFPSAAPIPRATLTRTCTSSVAAAASHELTDSLGCSQSNTDYRMASNAVPTPEQALLIARRSILVAQDPIHVQRVVRTLGVALGAIHMEAGTIRALHAVLQQLASPGMNNEEAFRSTGASRSNFIKWRRRVQDVQSAGGGKAVYEHLVRTPSCLLPRITTETLPCL